MKVSYANETRTGDCFETYNIRYVSYHQINAGLKPQQIYYYITDKGDNSSDKYSINGNEWVSLFGQYSS